jgi:hypothetical protein
MLCIGKQGLCGVHGRKVIDKRVRSGTGTVGLESCLDARDGSMGGDA